MRSGARHRVSGDAGGSDEDAQGPAAAPELVVEQCKLGIPSARGPVLAFDQEDLVEQAETHGVALVPEGNVDLLRLERVELVSRGDADSGDQLEEVGDEVLEGAAARGHRGCVVTVSEQLGYVCPIDGRHEGSRP